MPFLAPAIPFIAKGLGVLGAVGKGRAENRAAENEQLLKRQELALDSAKFNRQAPGARIAGAARGDLLANVQPASFSGGGRDLNVTGGLSPALLSQSSRQLGQNVSRQALLSQLGQGGANDPYTFDTTQFAPKKPGLLDKILGGAAITNSLLQTYGKQDDPQQQDPLGSTSRGI